MYFIPSGFNRLTPQRSNRSTVERKPAACPNPRGAGRGARRHDGRPSGRVRRGLPIQSGAGTGAVGDAKRCREDKERHANHGSDASRNT
ncbi:transcription initiation factor IIB [Halanaeroarchaeum sulfurireducens]|uniref:Transcription initiation factor IIB n=1 Tax=Halanaeroarchaeum sulfurireducens TaxID=1604004 RepID=A0A0F7PDB1_9EURY|nr:transcription initiation factor IIB [Halanaeroarchaeum sulfurireducens]ALG81745.1 transcription initiation factor IIB [Halanaeroarchaeum sulfurireducens]